MTYATAAFVILALCAFFGNVDVLGLVAIAVAIVGYLVTDDE